MNKNKLIKILYICIFLINNTIFSVQLKELIKNTVYSIKNKFFTKTLYQELCKKNLEIIADHRLDHVVGMKEVVEELENLSSRFISNKEPLISKIIITGDTRTGKTFLIEGFVGSVQTRLDRFALSTHTLAIDIPMIKKYGISNILKLIQLKAPVILYIDEDGMRGEFKNAHTILLEFLLKFEDVSKNFKSPIVLFFATQKTEDIGKTLITRFNKEIYCTYPNFEERKTHFEREFKKFNLNPADFDLNFLARSCKDVPYEKINYILHTGMMQAQIKGVPLSQSFIEKIIEKHMPKPIIMEQN